MMCSSTVEALLLAVFSAAPCASATQRQEGIWITPAEVRELATEGPAWEELLAFADQAPLAAVLGERDSMADVQALAKALVFVRTGQARYRNEAQAMLAEVVGSERSGDVLALARNLPSYLIAAELVGVPTRSEPLFRTWVKTLATEELEGTTLVHIHEHRPNNWGTHAGGARAAIARYLGDEHELERVAQVFRGWLGERASYAGFDYGDLDWQADPAHPVGINPRGAVRDGHSLDGVLPDDQRRAGGFAWPPPKENYVYEALQGALLQAVVLTRAGYEPFEWGDHALLRAARWLVHEARFPATGDDTWQPHVINHFYGVNLPAPVPARPGKNVGWTDWTLTGGPARRGGGDAPR